MRRPTVGSRRSLSSPDLLSEVLGGYRWTQLLYVAATLDIAGHLAGGPLTPAELASRCDAHPEALFRVLRVLASEGLFSVDGAGKFGLTPSAERLRRDAPDSLRPFALTYGGTWWWSAFGGLLHTVKTGETAFESVHGDPFFTYLAKHPDAAAVFQMNMSAMTAPEGDAVVAAVDVSATRVHVDVGGGQGALARAVLQAAPHARSVLFDRPWVLAEAPPRLEQFGIADRCTLVEGDFFVSVPEGGDLYTLKDILHDWDDAHAADILRIVRRAMEPSARLLIVERLIPPRYEPAVGNLMDINMLVLTGGRERTEAEYRTLLDASGLRLSRIISTTAGPDVLDVVTG